MYGKYLGREVTHMGNGARVMKDVLSVEPMTPEAMEESIGQLAPGSKGIIAFGKKAAQVEVRIFNELVSGGQLIVPEDARIELARVAAYTGEFSCWGACPRRRVKIEVTDRWDASAVSRLNGLVLALSHIVLTD
jgi:hypothetical protein